MPTSVLAAAGTAAATQGITKLFGPKGASAGAPLSGFAPMGFNAGGLTASFGGNNLTITPSAERLGLVRNVAAGFGQQAGLLEGLRGRVTPGFSDLRAARLGEIENARTSAIGNLRENLQRRRVLGSSFGQDTLARAEAEFGRERERVAAESFLQEIELTNQFIQQEFTARRSEFQTGLDELNLEANLAAGLTGKATETLGKNAQILAVLNAKEAEGAGKFFGQTWQPVFKSFGEGIGGLFKKGFGGTAMPPFVPSNAE